MIKAGDPRRMGLEDVANAMERAGWTDILVFWLLLGASEWDAELEVRT